MQEDGLRRGDLVEIKGAAEILATLDERGMLDGLPFMPEMIRFCGRRLVVDQRAEKICDTIYPLGSNRLPDTVLLGNLRCDGSGHDGCQADCRLFWKEAWIRRVSPDQPPASNNSDDAYLKLEQLTLQNTKVQVEVNARSATRYRCQNTELHRASKRLGIWDPRVYLRVYTTGNVGLWRFLRVIARAIVEEPMRKLGIAPRVWVRGAGSGPARPPALGLKPGDLIQVKSKAEIVATLDSEGKNRGLFFDREMLPYCGGTYRVKQRVTRFIDDRQGGEMIELKSDCVTLEGVVCSGELSPVRWFCPRKIQSFWRETWLRRVEQVPSDGAAGAPGLTTDRHVLELDHHPGSAQIEPAAVEPADESTVQARS